MFINFYLIFKFFKIIQNLKILKYLKQIESDNVKTDIRIYKSPEIFRSALEVETFVDSIDISETGKEITLNVETNIKNNNEFFTDSNGLHMQPRKINYRQTWDLNVSEPVSGNYYPINPIISFNDSNGKLRLPFKNK